MPAPIFDPLSNALHLSLTADDKNQNDLLDNRLISSTKSVNLSNIEFEETGTYQSNVVDSLKSKYTILKADKRLNEDKSLKKDSNSSFSSARAKQENALPTPKRILYPLSSVQLGWKSGWQIGSGMQNVGNTCYLNSTLQALFHVPAFANWLISETHHAEKCTQNGGCVICGMRKTLLDTQNISEPIKPWQVHSKLRLICRHLTPGRQEDAHEFLRYLVESMEKTYLTQLGGSAKQLDQFSKETTPLNQILGGYLRSAVRCLNCSHVSTTFQHFQDLLVDARKASTMDEALDSFFSRERLEDLGYKCEACNKKVSATKQFYIERAPMVLCIALKRFSLTGGKLSKHVQFKQRISLKKFIFHQSSQTMLAYRLVSVVTHLGPSQNCGHYTAVGLGPGSIFYHFDDSCVRPIPITNVLGTNAYIMFYELEKSEGIGHNKFNSQPFPAKSVIFTKKENEESLSDKKSSFIGPVMPECNRNKENSPMKPNFSPIKINGSNDSNSKPNGYRSNDNGTNITSSNEKPQSKLNLNLLSSTQSQAEHSQNNGKIHSNKTIYSNDNTSQRKAISNVLSPSKCSNIIQSSSNSTCSEVKATSSDIKTHVTNPQNKHNGSIQNITVHVNGEIKNKNKLNGEENKYNQTKAISNGSSTSRILVIPGSSNYSGQNGSKPDSQSGSTKKLCGLVPYGLESGEENLDDEEDEDDASARNKLSAPRPQIANKEIVATKATDHGWKVSNVVPVAHHSPSLNGVVNNTLIRSSKACNEQPTVVSNVSVNHGTSDAQKDVVSTLQRFSHQGYGGPAITWNGHHAQLTRQVFEDKKGQLKRAAEADDEMDRGRVKKVRHISYNKHYSNDFNAFQNIQNQRMHWVENANHKSRNHFPYHNKNFRNRPRARNMPHFRQHSGGNHYHSNHYSRNR